MKHNHYTLVSPNNRPYYRELIAPVSEAVWPEFMFHDDVANEYWGDLFSIFPDYQFALLDPDSQSVVGLGNSVPLSWRGEPEELPDEGWDWALKQSVKDHAAAAVPRTLCGIQISVAPTYQGKGISRIMIETMRTIGAVKGFKRLIIPVRPSLKHRYPLTPSERYIQWKDPSGFPFDPWLRVHARSGGEIVKVCHQAMRITGSVSEWQEWTGMQFPESGAYIIPGALVLVEIDLAKDEGVYLEPNVWVLHEIESEVI